MTPSRPTETDLPARLRMAVTRLARRLRQESGTALSPTQHTLLATVVRLGPVTLGDLAAQEGVRPPTVTAAIARLEEQGLVRRERDATDRRVTHVEATAEGRRVLERALSRRTAYLEQRIRALSAADRAALERAAAVLERLVEPRISGAAIPPKDGLRRPRRGPSGPAPKAPRAGKAEPG